MKVKTIKLVEENIGDLHELGVGGFLKHKATNHDDKMTNWPKSKVLLFIKSYY